MPLSNETVSLAGSGLIFHNSYSATVTDAYRSAVVTAENFLQAHFTGAVTVGVSFDFQPIAGGTGEGDFFVHTYSYGQVVGALTAHASTSYDAAAVAALPTVDPSNGVGFSLSNAQAQALGLEGPSGLPNDSTITLSSNEPWDFGQDAVGALEYELTQSVFGRVQSLGVAHPAVYDLRSLPLHDRRPARLQRRTRWRADGVRDFADPAVRLRLP